MIIPMKNWGYCKHRLSKFKGIKAEFFLLHLKECEFRLGNKENLLSCFTKIDKSSCKVAKLKIRLSWVEPYSNLKVKNLLLYPLLPSPSYWVIAASILPTS